MSASRNCRARTKDPGMEPDFKALALAWVANDPRMSALDEDRREALVIRIAEALSRRRGIEKPDDEEIGLVVNIDRDHFQPGGGLSNVALDQLGDFLQERIDQDKGV